MGTLGADCTDVFGTTLGTACVGGVDATLGTAGRIVGAGSGALGVLCALDDFEASIVAASFIACFQLVRRFIIPYHRAHFCDGCVSCLLETWGSAQQFNGGFVVHQFEWVWPGRTFCNVGELRCDFARYFGELFQVPQVYAALLGASSCSFCHAFD